MKYIIFIYYMIKNIDKTRLCACNIKRAKQDKGDVSLRPSVFSHAL